MVGSMICEMGGQVGWLATGMSFKYIRPVYFDEQIDCTIRITKIEETGRAEAEAVSVNEAGDNSREHPFHLIHAATLLWSDPFR